MVTFIGNLHSNETQFYQPNFSRSRQALRSPRNSESLNLEMSLFAYDVTKLYERIVLIEAVLVNDFTIMNNGDTTITNILTDDAIPTGIDIPSLEDITSRLKGFSDRLEILEKGL